MIKILLITALLFFSCVQKNQNVQILPDKEHFTEEEKTERFLPEKNEFHDKHIDKSSIEMDSSAQINIISQIPFEAFNLYAESDLCELAIRQNSPRTLLFEVPQNLLFNSIQMASEISDFARMKPASIRGIFGNLMGITEVANGTQKVIFGIIPRNAKVIEFRFETAVADTAVLNQLVWKYNTRFNISLSEHKISMNRRAGVFDGAKQITLENIRTNDPIKMLGENTDLSALLFKKSDFALVRSDLQDFRAAVFDNFTVSAFFGMSLDWEEKKILTNLLKTADYGKLDYNLRILNTENEETTDFKNFDRDSIVIIYDGNNLIAFETTMLLSQYLREKTAKKVVTIADFGQRRQYFFDYDIAISANSADLNERYLLRKYSNSKIDLFEMKIYLVSAQKIVFSSNNISKLGTAK